MTDIHQSTDNITTCTPKTGKNSSSGKWAVFESLPKLSHNQTKNQKYMDTVANLKPREVVFEVLEVVLLPGAPLNSSALSLEVL